MKIGSKVYWRKASGEVIFITPEIESDFARETTKEDDMGFYPQFKGFDPAQVEVLQLTYHQYYEDFQRAKSYIVNPETGKMEFVYVDDNGSGEPTPQTPLTDQLSELKARQDSTEAALLTLMDVATHA
ncbi:hypothetical protein ACT3XG_14570 [Paenibacillus polymyxa]|uniref:hypothetical protein n=1 Tax=Paenibacillus TaxID=44249 RepID=UPI00142DA324|nr:MULTISPECIES: hypothetical protein [Paenibacillus]KAF6658854.1 hypothetical protein HFD99_01155 [Paenibacillus sp. EKM301P]UBS85383.1 hypothetical protein LAZ93_14540 [Paenibacillus polymyxa]WHX33899.1 hypothetical protein QNH38_15005 [Paenibacillus polymyxa]